ncbi:hypothetical protein ACS0TY_033882 [Phlomoides rotata]
MTYDILRSPNPRVSWSSWIWGHSIPSCRSTLIWRLRQFGIHGPTVFFLCHSASESLDHIFAHCSFTHSLLCRVTTFFDLTLFYDIGFLDVFLQTTRFNFSKQSCLAFITASIKETDLVALGHFSGSVRELLILGHLGLSGRPLYPPLLRSSYGNHLRLVGIKLMLMVVPLPRWGPSLLELSSAILVVSLLRPSPKPWDGVSLWKLN